MEIDKKTGWCINPLQMDKSKLNCRNVYSIRLTSSTKRQTEVLYLTCVPFDLIFGVYSLFTLTLLAEFIYFFFLVKFPIFFANFVFYCYIKYMFTFSNN